MVRPNDGSRAGTLTTCFLLGVGAAVAGARLHRRLVEQPADTSTADALTDPLTGLPNRRLFFDNLQAALALAERHGRVVGVLFLDLDRFKVINDSMGHAAGDILLVEVADRLRAALRPSDTVARLGGDEFAVLCHDLAPAAPAVAAAVVADRIVEMVAEPLQVNGCDVVVTPSIGIAISAPGVGPDVLLRNADAAMYRAKDHGKARYELFDEQMQAQATQRFETETALRGALERGELSLHYQPIIDIGSGSTVAVEALLRWDHPEKGLIAPAEFVPLAEETGLIVPIGAWVLGEACRQVSAWRKTFPGRSDLRVAVNLSPRQLTSAGLVDSVAAALADNDLPEGAVCLEITESLLIADADASVSTLHALKTVGVSLALDDFGTGYSSLTYVQQFPIDHLKVDRSFVSDIDKGQNRQIVAALIGLAHSLGMPAVAEGVETVAQMEELQRLGCDQAQGYLIARPVPAAELALPAQVRR